MSDIPVQECPRCNVAHPATLFEAEDPLCPYCKTEVAEILANKLDFAREKRGKRSRTVAEMSERLKTFTPEEPEPKKPAPEPKPEVKRPKAEDLGPKAEDPKAIAKRVLVQRELMRRRLLPFVEHSKPKYLAGWVHKEICAKLEQFAQDVVDGKSPRLMLFMPPRHGKSQIASIDFPAWFLGHHPDMEVIACSYSASLAEKFSRKVRALVRTPEFQGAFPDCVLDPEAQAAEGWQLLAGGGYAPAGVNGPITGKGAHVLIIDDPVKNREEAESANQQEAVIDWYTSTAYTRLAPGGGVLVIMTRWHDADLAGKLLQAENDGGDKWEVISYPAIALEDEKYRRAGDALHPERYPVEALTRIKNALLASTGVRDWEALYQQNPVSNEGDYFSKKDIRYYKPEDIADKLLRYYAAFDFAIGKKEQNDYTVGIVVGVDIEDNIYIVDLIRGRWSSDDLIEQILDLYVKWKPSIVGLERGVIEMSIGPFLYKRIEERKLWEMFIEELKPGRRDKVARARAIQGRIQQGKVFFPAGGHFVPTLIAEMLRFPSGEHDDQVDALAWIGHMMAEFHGIKVKEEEKKKSWRDKLEKLARDVTRTKKPPKDGTPPGKRKSAMAA